MRFSACCVRLDAVRPFLSHCDVRLGSRHSPARGASQSREHGNEVFRRSHFAWILAQATYSVRCCCSDLPRPLIPSGRGFHVSGRHVSGGLGVRTPDHDLISASIKSARLFSERVLQGSTAGAPLITVPYAEALHKNHGRRPSHACCVAVIYKFQSGVISASTTQMRSEKRA